MCSGGSCIQAVNITVQLSNAGSPATTQSPYFDIRVMNNGTTDIPISQLTIRYWYTWEDTGTITQTFVTPTYFLSKSGQTSLPVSSITGTFTAITAVTGADHYVQAAFSTADGNLTAGFYMEMGLGMRKNDSSSYTQTGDYSYNGSTSLATTTTVTVYLGGALVYGVEPM
jgi:hypothetical protein